MQPQLRDHLITAIEDHMSAHDEDPAPFMRTASTGLTTSLGPQALLLTGTVGVGKSTVAEAVAGLLSSSGVPNAYVDVDGLRRMWPAPTADPFNSALAVRNLSSLSANFVDAGVVRLVVAGVVETRAELVAYEAAVGMPLVTCRLQASGTATRNRLISRHADDSEALSWHLRRADELAQLLDAADLADHTVDVTTTSVRAAAREVTRVIGWIP